VVDWHDDAMGWCHSSAATEINRLSNWHRVRWARKKQRVSEEIVWGAHRWGRYSTMAGI
jgi:hypothetical protein